ncbi:DUF3037 domain-containing protein [Terriglobus saanensis]|uniref:DUF3037 domain-containing protein n=1 Tax=Terriglobus saanensis TaxID=870903 RepID=UPI000325EC33|nr:DUF3037 domain-containing protein [Terriglobus saanensis]
MASRMECEFFLVRYVPDTVKNEFVNIGVLLREAGRAESTRVRFTRDWSRVRCLDPDADTAMLEAMETEIAERLKLGEHDFKPVLQVMEDTLSNSLQLTEPRGCLAENLSAEMEQLMRMYVETVRERVIRPRTGRAAIAATMREEFERANVWDLMRKRISASQYTRVGDPLKIDCGYRPNGIIRMFQAISLEGDLEAAKVLAFSSSGLREGVQRLEGASLELTAIVEPLREMEDETAAVERYRFGVETMERESIRVLTVSDLERVAQTARRELNL